MSAKGTSVDSNSSTSRSHTKNAAMSKRASIKQLIQQYYFQLTEGCGRTNCSNSECASNPNFETLSSDDAAARAMNLCKNKNNLCEKSPSKIPRKDLCENPDQQKIHSNNKHIKESSKTSNKGDIEMKDVSSGTQSSSSNQIFKESGCGCAENINKKLEKISVTEPMVTENSIRENAEYHYALLSNLSKSLSDESNVDTSAIKRSIWHVFSNSDCLSRFGIMKEDLKSQCDNDEDKDVDEAVVKMDESGASGSGQDMVVEETPVKSVEKLSMDDLDSEESPKCSKIKEAVFTAKDSNGPNLPTVDMDCVRNFYKYCVTDMNLETVMINALTYLIKQVDAQLTAKPHGYKEDKHYLNTFAILMENFALHSPQGLDTVFPGFCKLIANLPLPAQAALAHYWSSFNQDRFQTLVENIQQLITFKVVTEVDVDGNSSNYAHTNQTIIAAARTLNIFYYASILGGTIDKEIDESGKEASSQQRLGWSRDDDFNIGLIDGSDRHSSFDWIDPLGKELQLCKMDIVKPLLPLAEFINQPLNDHIVIDKDYANYRVNQTVRDKNREAPIKFSFLHYPFLLTTINKTTHLFYDNRVRMFSERRRTLFSSLMQGSFIHPYLKIQVRRSHVIDDALIQLELASENVKDFKKQLYVEFDGEEGVDEGGVSKEFFQLVIDKIFDAGNGMFIHNEDTRLFWFNPHSFEGLTQYKLIGIVLGLAIYNNCILDINFPTFLYKKLLGRKGSFHDMAEFHPVMYKTLCHLLEYEGNVEEDMMLTFCVGYKDIYGVQHTYDLKENGEKIPITNDNRKEYVHMYADWLLNTSVSKQFNAFLCGFDMVIHESPIKYLFDANELELLIRGSENYDFDELERTTEYDGGFTKESQTIKDFWSVVHHLSDVEKRTLLQFSTGSDRAPMGGLSKLKMIIAKNGPNSDRLPTAHTCFNVILLPDYADREKLKERLLKAIKYSKGFGML